MEQYISKDALVREIERKIKKYTKSGEESDAKRDGYGMYWGGVLSCLNEIWTLCDTFEVKEVDISSMADEYYDALIKEAEMDVDMAGHCRLAYYNGCKDMIKAQKGE